MNKFTVQHEVPGNPISDGFLTSTVVEVEDQIGVFTRSFRISAFDGEIEIYIHTTSGHYLNWCVVVLMADTAPIVFEGPRYDRQTKIGDAMAAITSYMKEKYVKTYDTCWWSNAFEQINSIIQ